MTGPQPTEESEPSLMTGRRWDIDWCGDTRLVDPMLTVKGYLNVTEHLWNDGRE